MSTAITDHLATSPLVWTATTVAVYAGSVWLHRRARHHPALTPVLVTVIVLSSLLHALGVEYSSYLRAVSAITFLLGPATVALALPMYRSGASILHSWRSVAVALVLGAAVSVTVTLSVTLGSGAGAHSVLSALPRSVTTPVALGISDVVGATDALVAGFSIASGVLGATCAPTILNLVGVRDPRARGFAIGTTSHGIGTSRALAESQQTGGWSSAGMVLHAFLMTMVVPVVAAVLD